MRELKSNQLIEREITAKEAHFYKFNLQTGEFFQVKIEQKGVDVLLKLLDAEGTILATMDSPNSKEGFETISFVASKDGNYKLEISGFDEKAGKAGYAIKREAARTATVKDKRRVEVEKLFVEGLTAREAAGQDEQAIKKLDEALSGWRELNDQYLITLTARQIQILVERNLPKDPLFKEAHSFFQQGTLDGYEAAREKFKAASEVYAKSGEKYKAAICLAFTGLSDKKTGNNTSALKNYNAALPLFGLYEDEEWRGILLSEIGLVYFALKENSKALEFFFQSLPISKSANDKAREAITLIGIAEIYSITKDHQKTIETYSQASKIKVESGDLEGANQIAGILIDLAGSVENQERLQFYTQALQIYKATNNKTRLVVLLNNVGLIYDSLRESRKALELYNQALPIQEEIGDKLGIASTLHNSGLAYDSLNEKEKALELLNKSLSIFKEINYKEGELQSLNDIAEVYRDLGNLSKTLEYYNLTLPLIRETGDKESESSTLTGIGQLYSDLGDKQKALEIYSQSLLISRAAKNESEEAKTLNNIGKVYNDLGDLEKSLEYYYKAQAINKSVKNTYLESILLNNIGRVLNENGNPQESLKLLFEALEITRKDNNKLIESKTLNNLGLVYWELNEKQKALDYYSQALPLIRAANDKVQETVTLINISQTNFELGEYEKSMAFLDRALLMAREGGYLELEANALNSYGHVYSVIEDNEKALVFYEKALSISRKIDDKGGESVQLNNISTIYRKLNKKREAIEFLNKALLITRQTKELRKEALILSNLMILWKETNPELAIFYGKQSVNKIQSFRKNITSLDKEIQKSYLKSVEDNYRYLASSLLEADRLSEAHQVANYFKDQQFFDFDKSQRKEPTPLALNLREIEFASIYEKTSDRVSSLTFQLEALRRKDANQPVAETAQLQKLENDLKTETDAFLGMLKQAETEFAKPADEKDKIADVPDTREIQTALRNLNQQTGQKTVAVYTLVGEDDFRALIVSPDGIKAVSVPVKRDALNEKALRLWSLLQSDRYDPNVLSKEIYDVVFRRIEAELPKDTTTIMWSLDGNLRYLPMAALWDGNRYLAEKYNHVNFTRADGTRLTRAVSANWSGTGFGTSTAQTVELFGEKISFSRLPGVTVELSEIFKQTGSGKGILTGAVLSDTKFNKTGFLAAMKQKRPLVHIASHFSFRPGDEARSFLLLGDGTTFTLSQMKAEASLFQDVDLLTLSACNTAAAQPDATGREIDGFAELAQRLGAGAVMATLWAVSDASTPWLMRDFYATRQSRTGTTKSEALRKAQLALLNGTAKTAPLPAAEKSDGQKVKIVIIPKGGKRDAAASRSDVIYLDEADAPPYKKDAKKPFAHPYYWSPFVLFGNWK